MSRETFFKIVRPDGRDRHTGTVLWAPERGIPAGGWLVEHPDPGLYEAHGDLREEDRRRCADPTYSYMPNYEADHPRYYLSVSTVASDAYGMSWPCRLLEVEPVDGVPVAALPGANGTVRASLAWRVVRELPAHRALGPCGEEVVQLIARVEALTDDEDAALDEAWTRDIMGALDDDRAGPNTLMSVLQARTAAQHAHREPALDAALRAAERPAWTRDTAAAIKAAEEEVARTGGDLVDEILRHEPSHFGSREIVRNAVYGTLARDLLSTDDHERLLSPWWSVVGRDETP